MKALTIGLILLPSFAAIAMSVKKLIALHVALLKVFDYVSCLSEITCRFPSCLLISLPLDPVLDPIPLDLLVKDCFDFVFFLTFNDVRRCVVPPPQESMDNSPSLFDYGLDDPYNDLINDFDPYLEYGEGYWNSTAFRNAFYR